MEEGRAKRLVQVGIRNMTPRQREQAKRFDVEVIEMRNWQSGAVLVEFDSPVYYHKKKLIEHKYLKRYLHNLEILTWYNKNINSL